MITIIVAADKNNLIGKKGTDNGMPWHNSEDFKHFRSTTLNHTLLMGKQLTRLLVNLYLNVIQSSSLITLKMIEQKSSMTQQVQFKTLKNAMKISLFQVVHLCTNRHFLIVIRFFYHVFLEIIQEKLISLTFLNITTVSQKKSHLRHLHQKSIKNEKTYINCASFFL